MLSKSSAEQSTALNKTDIESVNIDNEIINSKNLSADEFIVTWYTSYGGKSIWQVLQSSGALWGETGFGIFNHDNKKTDVVYIRYNL